MTNNRPFLYFNFKNHQDIVEQVTFTNPVNIIETDDPEEVTTCLNEVQQAINDGYYAAGYVAYEAAAAFHTNMSIQTNTPLLWFGIFPKPSNESKSENKPFNTTAWQPSLSVEEYNEAFERVLSYMKQGETEQVNLTIQMKAQFQGDPFSFYKQLEHAQTANYSAYLDIDDVAVLSASPELFFQMKDGEITTKPMKGTVGRGTTYEADKKNAEWLRHSEKNRHENELIIEVMKKDLEKIAKPHTISIPRKFEIEQYPTVYQMTSTVTAQVKQDVTVANLFQALFPCGSITGLPKKRTMELINELEHHPRGIYCGAIGFFTPNQEAIFNVPIRTVVIDNASGKAVYGVGGAITMDSTKEEEYEEILTKAEVLTEKRGEFQLLETLGLYDGNYIVFDYHIQRLKQSAEYFNYLFNEQKIREKLQAIARGHDEHCWKVRVLLNEKGTTLVEAEKIQMIDDPVPVTLAKKPIDRHNRFLYHKTTNRTLYDTHCDHQPEDCFDVLLWNQAEQMTEFTTGNLVIELDGQLITPPVKCGLLPGTFRQSLVDNGEITERVITKQDLVDSQQIWFINSVRKWIAARLV